MPGCPLHSQAGRLAEEAPECAASMVTPCCICMGQPVVFKLILLYLRISIVSPDLPMMSPDLPILRVHLRPQPHLTCTGGFVVLQDVPQHRPPCTRQAGAGCIALFDLPASLPIMCHAAVPTTATATPSVLASSEHMCLPGWLAGWSRPSCRVLHRQGYVSAPGPGGAAGLQGHACQAPSSIRPAAPGCT